MKASHIGALLLASTGLLACGGGGDSEEMEMEIASAPEMHGKTVTTAESGSASATSVGEEGNSTIPQMRILAAGPNYQPSANHSDPNKRIVHWVTHFGDGRNPASRDLIAKSAADGPLLRWRLDPNGKVYYKGFNNLTEAIKACDANLQQCRSGTSKIYEIWNARLRNSANKGTCSAGMKAVDVYDGYINGGRQLMGTKQQVLNVVLFGSLGIAIYAAIDTDWSGDVSAQFFSSLSAGAKQGLVALTTYYIFSHVGKNLDALTAQSLITMQNAGARAYSAAVAAGGTNLFSEMCAAIPGLSTYWPGVADDTYDRRLDGMELGLPQIEH